jgi:hypothetical protein
LGPIPNPQSPIPNAKFKVEINYLYLLREYYNKIKLLHC